MNKFSFFTQLVMIAIAIAIVFMYIEPKISSIRDTQDLVTNYESETQNVSRVNESLKSKIAAIDSIAPEDSQALARFMPDTVDEIAVLKDLEALIKTQAVTEYDVEYRGNNSLEPEGDQPNEYGNVTEEYFSLSFVAGYQQLKTLLTKLETNDYLLQVSNMKISDAKGDLLKVELSLTAFSLPVSAPEITQ